LYIPMRILPDRARSWINPRKKSGEVPLSLDRTEQLIKKLSRDDLEDFCLQGAEALPREAFSNPLLMGMIRDKCGDEVLPVSINSLKDDSASRDWLLGAFELPTGRSARRHDAVRNRKATQALQRALMKIGVYHPDLDDKQRAIMLQLPYGATGIMTRETMKALWLALEISGRKYMQERLAFKLPLDFNIAWAIEEMLADRRMGENPTTKVPYIALPRVRPQEEEGKAPPETAMYLGLTKFGADEEHHLKRVFNGTGIMLDSLVDWEAEAGDIEYRGRLFSLRHAAELDTFLAEAFQPELTLDQLRGLEEVFTQWNIGPDSLDEIAEIMIAFHEAEHGKRNLHMLIVAGHHSPLQGSVYADAGGMFPDRLLGHLAKLFPKAASQIEFVMIAASNRLFDYHVIQDLEVLPQFQKGGRGVAFGYRGRAPGTWKGGLNQCIAATKSFLESREKYERKKKDKALIVTWGMFNKHLWRLKIKSPDGLVYTSDCLDNLVIYNAQDARYRLGSDSNARRLERTDDVEAAPVVPVVAGTNELPQPERTVSEDSGRRGETKLGVIQNRVDFNSVLQGTFPEKDLRDIAVDDPDLVAYRESLSEPELRRKVDLALYWKEISNHWLTLHMSEFDEAVRDLLWAHEELVLKEHSPFFTGRSTIELRSDSFGDWIGWERKAQEVIRLAGMEDPPIPVDEETVKLFEDFRKVCLKLNVDDEWLADAGLDIPHSGGAPAMAALAPIKSST